MQKVFIVIGGVDYEGSSPLRAFMQKDEAEKFAQECREYERNQPAFDSKKPGSWSRIDKAWRRKHPAGEDAAGNDYYIVAEIDLIGGSQ